MTMLEMLKAKRWPIAAVAALVVTLGGAAALGVVPQNIGDDLSLAAVGAGSCTHPGGTAGINLVGNPSFESALAATGTAGNWTPYQENPGTPGAAASVASARGSSGLSLPPGVIAPVPHTGTWGGFALAGQFGSGTHNLTQRVNLQMGNGYEFSFWVWPTQFGNGLPDSQSVSVVAPPMGVGTTVVRMSPAGTYLSTGFDASYADSPAAGPRVAAPAVLNGQWNSVKVLMRPTPGTTTPGTVSLSVNNSPLVTTPGGVTYAIGSPRLVLGHRPGYSSPNASGIFYDDICLTQGATVQPVTGASR